MIKTKFLFIFCILMLFFASTASAAVPVFPGAEGFGSTTVAGRGGQIIKVTNLNDSGVGSLRAALIATGPRIVVFEVSGAIELKTHLRISSPFITIAGQTAPDPGIELRNGEINVATHDVLIQHIRVRPGDDVNAIGDSASRGGIIVTAGAYNVVIDHCTTMWATDENMAIWSNTATAPIRDVTFSNNLIAECLLNGSYGIAIGTSLTVPNLISNISVIDNLFAHHSERSPKIGSNVSAVIANNLAYNSKYEFTGIGSSYGPSKASVLGNHYITGSSNGGSTAIVVSASGSQVFQQDNLVTGLNPPKLFNDATRNSVVSSAPVSHPSITVSAMGVVKANVLKQAGARPAFRDSAEVRVVREVETATGAMKDSFVSTGGWISDYNQSKTRAFNIPASPSADSDSDGYTNIEEVLHQMAAEVEGKTTSPTPTPTPEPTPIPTPEPQPTPQPLPLKYSLTNFTALLSNWLKSGLGLAGDINIDGKVNSKDLGIMMSNWE